MIEVLTRRHESWQVQSSSNMIQTYDLKIVNDVLFSEWRRHTWKKKIGVLLSGKGVCLWISSF